MGALESDWQVSVDFTPLGIAAGMYGAKAWVRHRTQARVYWLRGIVGPDGVMVVEDRLEPPRDPVPVIGRRDDRPRHGYTVEDIVAEIRRAYAAEFGS